MNWRRSAMNWQRSGLQRLQRRHRHRSRLRSISRRTPPIYRDWVCCMKKGKAAVLWRGAWRNVRRTMRRSTGRSCRKPTDAAMRIRPTPLHVWERHSAVRSRFLRHISGRHAGRFSAEI